MIYSVEIAIPAKKDLLEIYEYIACSLGSKPTASKYLNMLEEQILGLDRFPERFQKYDKEPWLSRGLRLMPIKNFVVCYIPDVTTQKVTVTRVMYGRRDIATAL